MNIRGPGPPLPVVHFDPHVIRDHEIAAPNERGIVGILQVLNASERRLTISRRGPVVICLIPTVDADGRVRHEGDGIRVVRTFRVSGVTVRFRGVSGAV